MLIGTIKKFGLDESSPCKLIDGFDDFLGNLNKKGRLT
jgi:hypothetical protein